MTMWFDDFAADFAKRNARCRYGQVIYCISEAEKGAPVKVGLTTDIHRRLAQIQAHTWRKVTLHWCADGWAAHESALKRLSAGKTIHGEWFRDDDDAIKNLLSGQGHTEDALRFRLEKMAHFQRSEVTQ